MNECQYHDGHQHRISRNEEEIQGLWKESKELDIKRDSAVRRIHKRIDLMQWSIVGAIFAVSLNAIIGIFQHYENRSKTKDTRRIELILENIESRLSPPLPYQSQQWKNDDTK